MTKAHELDRTKLAGVALPRHDEAVAPGRATRSNALVGPNGPMPSGIILRKARDANGVEEGAGDAVARAASSSGASLPDTLMRKFESSLGADLSGVRVHTGGASVEAASAVGAKAYTVGQDIHFGAGHFDPSSTSGEHLIAHEVAHTVQQAGGVARMQLKPAVSSPGDVHEVEADRAADAMVAGRSAAFGRSAMAGSGQSRIYRDQDDSFAKQLANQSGDEMRVSQATDPSAVLQVSNVRDRETAQGMLAILNKSQPILEQGVSQGEVSADKLTTNGKAIADLELYMSAADAQQTSTSHFQEQYGRLLTDFGRIDGLGKKYSGNSIMDVRDSASAQKAVSDQAAIDGHDPDELKSQFEQLKKDPVVSTNITAVQNQMATVKGMPSKVEAASQTSASALSSVHTDIMDLRAALNTESSAELQTAFSAAKAKTTATEGLAGKIASALASGGAGGAKTITGSKGTDASQAQVNGQPVSMSLLGSPAISGQTSNQMITIPGKEAGARLTGGDILIGKGVLKEAALSALSGGALGLLSVGAGVAWKLLEPSVNQLITEMDIDVGKFPDKRDDTAKAKNDEAVYERARSAAEHLRIQRNTFKTAMQSYFDAWGDLDKAKAALKADVDSLGTAIESAASARGNTDVGKKLTEMTQFISEGTSFLAQADTGLEIGQKELDRKDENQNPAQAAQRMGDLNSRAVYLAYQYEGREVDGKRATHVGVNPTAFSVSDWGRMDLTEKESRGLGTASERAFQGGLELNGVIGKALENVKTMQQRVDLYVKAVNSLVFGGALAAKES